MNLKKVALIAACAIGGGVVIYTAYDKTISMVGLCMTVISTLFLGKMAQKEEEDENEKQEDEHEREAEKAD